MDQAKLYNVAAQLTDILSGRKDTMRERALAESLRRSLAMVEDPFIYRAQFLSLAPAATATFQINIQADSDFKILAGSYHANNTNAAQSSSTFTYPLIDVLLTDQGSGRNLMDNPVSIPALFGNGQLPFIWPVPKTLSARSTLQVQVTNYDAAVTYNIRGLYFIGVKLFPLGS